MKYNTFLFWWAIFFAVWSGIFCIIDLFVWHWYGWALTMAICVVANVWCAAIRYPQWKEEHDENNQAN